MSDEYNAADRRDVSRAKKASAVADLQRAEVTKNLMSTEPGRRWIHDLLWLCNYFEATTFAAQAETSAFNEGQRAVAQRVIEDIFRTCPDSFTLMLRERNERHAARTNRTANGSGQDGDVGGPDPGDGYTEGRDETRT